MIADPSQSMQADMQQNKQQADANSAKKAHQRAIGSGENIPKTVPDGYDIRQAALAPTMHKGGIVPGEKGEKTMIKAEAGEKVMPASEGRNSEYRKVYISRRKSKS